VTRTITAAITGVLPINWKDSAAGHAVSVDAQPLLRLPQQRDSTVQPGIQ